MPPDLAGAIIKGQEEAICPSEHDVAPVVGDRARVLMSCRAAIRLPTGRSESTQAISRVSWRPWSPAP